MNSYATSPALSAIDPALLSDIDLKDVWSDTSALAQFQALLQEVYALSEEMLSVLADSMSRLASAEGDLQQAQFEKQFQEIQKQIESNSKNKLLKIFKPLLAALGLLLVAALPIEPFSKGALILAMTALFAASLQQSLTGDNFMLDLFQKIASGNESLANWLLLGFEAALMLVTLAAGFGAACPSFVARLGQWASKAGDFVASAGSRLGQSADAIRKACSSFAETIQGLSRAELSALSGAMKNAAKKMAERIQSCLPSVESVTEGAHFQKFIQTVFTPDMQKKIERFANYLMILGGVVTAGLTVDKALTDMALAGITEDVQYLAAVQELFEPERNDLTKSIDELQSFISDLSNYLDTVLKV